MSNRERQEGGETMAGIHAERDIWKHLMEVMERLEQVEAAAKEERVRHCRECAQLKDRIRELEAECKGKDEIIRKLEAEVARLKQQAEKDSHNSSLPPSTDEKPSKAPNEYNGRKKTKRKTGGQAGHKGKTRRLEETVNELRKNGIEPKIEDIGDTARPYKERLVLDIAMGTTALIKRFHEDENGKYSIPEAYHSEVVYGEDIKALVILLYGQGVLSAERIVEMISALTKGIIQLSQGTVFNWLEAFSRGAEPSLACIEEHLLNQEQVSTDATVVTVNGKQAYIRNFSVKDWALYVPVERKSKDALSGIPFLQKFTGILAHDHETTLYHFGTGHAECNVHLIRYLTANTENTGHKWSSHLISLLVEMNRYRKRLLQANQSAMPEKTISRLEARYDELLVLARRERKLKPCRFRWASAEETALLNRLKKYKQNHLLFLHDFRVPFDNNMSERDLRKCKNRQKMSGGFRSDLGQRIFCTLLSITESCKRQHMNLMHAFRSIFSGQFMFQHSMAE